MAPGWTDRKVARAISRVEAGEGVALPAVPRRAHVVGFTGSPGAGKSTLVDRFVAEAREEGLTVAVLAVDPSSPMTGGAVLADRVRMGRHATDEGVFIRSMGSRGATTGLAQATGSAVRVLDAAGYDVIVVETVGVGQVELEIVSLADMVLVLVVPGLGDSYQLNKAGVMEVGDVYVVNQADRPETPRFVRELRTSLSIGRPRTSTPPVCQTVAVTGEGVAELWQVVRRGYGDALTSGDLQERRRTVAALELRAAVRVATQALGDRLVAGSANAEALADQLSRGVISPGEAAQRLLRESGLQGP